MQAKRIRLEDWNRGIQLMIDILDPSTRTEEYAALKAEALSRCVDLLEG